MHGVENGTEEAGESGARRGLADAGETGRPSGIRPRRDSEMRTQVEPGLTAIRVLPCKRLAKLVRARKIARYQWIAARPAALRAGWTLPILPAGAPARQNLPPAACLKQARRCRTSRGVPLALDPNRTKEK
jgi:hypothetical protein